MVRALLGHSFSAITRDVYMQSIPSDAPTVKQKVEDFLIRTKLTQVIEIEKTVARYFSDGIEEIGRGERN
jgi:hypothetical protein